MLPCCYCCSCCCCCCCLNATQFLCCAAVMLLLLCCTYYIRGKCVRPGWLCVPALLMHTLPAALLCMKGGLPTQGGTVPLSQDTESQFILHDCTILLPTKDGTVHIMHTLRHILHDSVRFSYLHWMALCTLCIHYVTSRVALYDFLTYTEWHCAHYAYTTSHPAWLCTILLPTQDGTVHLMHTLSHILHGSVQFSYLHRMALCTLCIHYVTSLHLHYCVTTL